MFILLFIYSVYCCECDSDSKCIPGVGCIPLEIENECVKRCGRTLLLYDSCLNPSFHCDYTTQTLVDTNKCFENPVCLSNVCLRGVAIECESGHPCDSSQGCPERNTIHTLTPPPPIKECLLKCGNSIYNSCLLPTVYCDEKDQTVKDKNKCFNNPVCYQTECLRGGTIECDNNVPCDPSLGCVK